MIFKFLRIRCAILLCSCGALPAGAFAQKLHLSDYPGQTDPVLITPESPEHSIVVMRHVLIEPGYISDPTTIPADPTHPDNDPVHGMTPHFTSWWARGNEWEAYYTAAGPEPGASNPVNEVVNQLGYYHDQRREELMGIDTGAPGVQPPGMTNMTDDEHFVFEDREHLQRVLSIRFLAVDSMKRLNGDANSVWNYHTGAGTIGPDSSYWINGRESPSLFRQASGSPYTAITHLLKGLDQPTPASFPQVVGECQGCLRALCFWSTAKTIGQADYNALFPAGILQNLDPSRDGGASTRLVTYQPPLIVDVDPGNAAAIPTADKYKHRAMLVGDRVGLLNGVYSNLVETLKAESMRIEDENVERAKEGLSPIPEMQYPNGEGPIHYSDAFLWNGLNAFVTQVHPDADLIEISGLGVEGTVDSVRQTMLEAFNKLAIAVNNQNLPPDRLGLPAHFPYPIPILPSVDPRVRERIQFLGKSHLRLGYNVQTSTF